MAKRQKVVRCREEFAERGSATLSLMRYFEALGEDIEMTREEFIGTNYMGDVDPDGEVSPEEEETWPEQFQRKTLIETAPISNRKQ